MDEPAIRIRLLVNGKAVQPTPEWSIRFEQVGLEVHPALYRKNTRVPVKWMMKADIWMPDQPEEE